MNKGSATTMVHLKTSLTHTHLALGTEHTYTYIPSEVIDFVSELPLSKLRVLKRFVFYHLHPFAPARLILAGLMTIVDNNNQSRLWLIINHLIHWLCNLLLYVGSLTANYVCGCYYSRGIFEFVWETNTILVTFAGDAKF